MHSMVSRAFERTPPHHVPKCVDYLFRRYDESKYGIHVLVEGSYAMQKWQEQCDSSLAPLSDENEDFLAALRVWYERKVKPLEEPLS